MLALIVAALGAAADAGGTAVAAWGDIAFTNAFGGSSTTSSTITFSSGGPRTFSVTHDIALGSLSVQVGSGPITAVSSGDTFVATTGQTIVFTYACYFHSESATVTVTDDAAAATVDTFTCTLTYTGPPIG